jgi:hypothetical protein
MKGLREPRQSMFVICGSNRDKPKFLAHNLDELHLSEMRSIEQNGNFVSSIIIIIIKLRCFRCHCVLLLFIAGTRFFLQSY